MNTDEARKLANAASARADAATRGDWFDNWYYYDGDSWAIGPKHSRQSDPNLVETKADAAFIAAARADVPALADALIAALDENAALREALQSLRITEHYDCEDGWYSCPKVPGYWGTGDETRCNCGMDRTNAIIDNALGESPELPPPPEATP